MDFAIKIDKLGLIYIIRDEKKGEAKELIALHELDMEVQTGECFGLLGLNRAGKPF